MSTTTEMVRKSYSTSIKQAVDPRTFAVTISTGAEDRDGDRIDPRGWQLQSFRGNPIVLWQHNKNLPPIARATDVREQGNNLVAEMEFPPTGISPLADEICGLMKAGFLHSTSVGFLPLRSTPNGRGHDIHEAELMEFSVVNIPSQIEARVMRCARQSCDAMRLKHWLGSRSTHHHEEDNMKYLEIDDGLDTKEDDPFQAMCDRMLAAYSEMDSAKFRELMLHQISTLGPLATIDDLVRGIMANGVVAQRSWSPELYDIDERELAVAIGHMVATEIPRQTRAALNAAMGRLD